MLCSNGGSCHCRLAENDGGALVLTGPNGSDKSTLLRLLAGFSRPSAIDLLWNGHDVIDSGVYQQYRLQLNWLTLKDAIYDGFTVLENVQWFEVLEGKIGKAKDALEFMGLGRLANEKPRRLSMGQRKRVQLARLIAIDGLIWLLDEPSVALGAEGVKLLEQIRNPGKKAEILMFRSLVSLGKSLDENGKGVLTGRA